MASEKSRRLARKVMGALRRKYGAARAKARHDALEEMLLGVLADGTSERKAANALAALSDAFVDWNELRVCPVLNIAAQIPALPEAVRKSASVRAVLQRVYDANNEMSLEFLRERSPRDAARLVSGLAEFPESALARATVLALGHDELPPTSRVVLVCRRLSLVSDPLDGVFGKLVPRASMYEFHHLVTRHATEVCLADIPKCQECCLHKDCRHAHQAARAASAAETARRAESRTASKKKRKK